MLSFRFEALKSVNGAHIETNKETEKLICSPLFSEGLQSDKIGLYPEPYRNKMVDLIKLGPTSM